MKRRITYILSNLDKALAFEWIAEHLSYEKYELSFILLNPETSDLYDFLEKNKIPVKWIAYHGKKDIPRALYQTYLFLRKQKPDIVHCHLFDASLVGLTAARLAGIKMRVHTRHHSSYHQVYHPHAVRYDKYINRLSTHIVAVSQVVKDLIIKEGKDNAKKIRVIHHGFDWKDFPGPGAGKDPLLMRKYGLNESHPIIGVISRFTEWKGIQYIIPAFKKILPQYPRACLLLLNAKGDHASHIHQLLNEMPVENYRTIEFENKGLYMYRIFDVFVHVPIDEHSEAFGQVYIEAMASGTPSVFTLSGVAPEVVIDGQNALVVPFKSSKAIYQAIIRILEDHSLSKNLSLNAVKAVQENFSIHKMIFNLEHLYDS